LRISSQISLVLLSFIYRKMKVILMIIKYLSGKRSMTKKRITSTLKIAHKKTWAGLANARLLCGRYDELIQAFEELNLVAMAAAIEKGASVNCAHPDGGSLLSVAVDHALDSCIQAGGSPGDEEKEFVDLLLKNGADIHLKYGGSSSAIECAKAYKSANNMVAYLETFNS